MGMSGLHGLSPPVIFTKTSGIKLKNIYFVANSYNLVTQNYLNCIPPLDKMSSNISSSTSLDKNAHVMPRHPWGR